MSNPSQAGLTLACYQSARSVYGVSKVSFVTKDFSVWEDHIDLSLTGAGARGRCRSRRGVGTRHEESLGARVDFNAGVNILKRSDLHWSLPPGNLTVWLRYYNVIYVSQRGMSVSRRKKSAAWLLLVFTLPTAKASARVGVWRKLQRYGALALPASGYVLPNNPVNQERFEWLASSIRSSKGNAAVAQVRSFDELRHEQIEHMFSEARDRDYQALERELKQLSKSRQREKSEAGLLRLKRRLQQVAEIDFFGSPLKARIEEALRQLEAGQGSRKEAVGKHHAKDYRGRTWITRPHPGIDRVASAWLILRHIDAQAKFAFDNDPRRHPSAVPFDMFNVDGFGHVGNNCTFETLVKSFGLKDSRLQLVAQAIHDADLADERFGREEALGIDRILDGWNRQGMSNEEVLRKGLEMIEGLYNGIR